MRGRSAAAPSIQLAERNNTLACISSALVIGGGIAGLSSAIALARVGVRCDVIELSDTPQGASLGISGRATDALVELGIYDAVHDTGTPFGPDSDVTSLRDSTGRVISPGPQRARWPGAKDAVAVYRPVFVDVMTDAARRLGVGIRYGVTAHDIANSEQEVTVGFTDGEQRRYDLLVGADGIGLNPSHPLPRRSQAQYAGQLSIRWMAPGPAIADAGWYVGPVGRLGFYYLPQGMVYVPAVITMAEPRHLTDDELFSLFTRLLDSFSAPAVVELRNRLEKNSQLIGRFFEWILVPEPWHRGRAVLIGDAAHATTAHMGMGGGMALEDSVVLAQCLAGSSDLPEALSAFMSRRFERVRSVVETSVRLSRGSNRKKPRQRTTRPC